MLYYLPIEPYKTRYTADWIKQFEHEFGLYGMSFGTILGPDVNDTVTEGGVLDACGTHLYKFGQLSHLIDLIKRGRVLDGDIVFFADLWFPGIEALFYIRDMLKIRFKIAGIFHAGTYDKADFTYRSGMREWGKFLEMSWFTAIDDIFVATHFHKQLLMSNSFVFNWVQLSDKIHVTGLPFYAEELKAKYDCSKKENIVVFPHRLDAEKHPEKFDELEKQVKAVFPDCEFIKTIKVCSTREEYFKLLAKSKVMVSFADQETFGYSTLEAMALGCEVWVPDRLSYRETVPEVHRYKDESELAPKVIDSLRNYVKRDYPLSEWESSVRRMLNILN